MNEAFQSIYILSDEKSSKYYNGSLRVNGGIGVKKNIIVNEELKATDIIATNSITARNNLYLSGKLTISSTLFTNDKNIVFEKDIVSNQKDNDTRYNIGNNNKRWENIYCKNIDSYTIKSKINSTIDLNATGNITLGNKENPTIVLDTNAPNTAIIKGNLFILDDSNKANITYIQDHNQLYLKTDYFDVNGLLSVHKNNRYINVNGYMASTVLKINNYLQITPQYITIEKEQEEITIYSSLIFININNNSNITLSPPKDISFDNTIIKIIILETNNMSININNKYKMSNNGDCIELFYKEDGVFIKI